MEVHVINIDNLKEKFVCSYIGYHFMRHGKAEQ